MPQVDAATWKLTINGMVDNPLTFTYDELLAMRLVEEPVTLSCVSNEVGGDLVGNAVWRGVPLTTLLDRAGVHPGATQIVGRSVDDFTVGFPTEQALDGRTALVAFGMNGEPLPGRPRLPRPAHRRRALRLRVGDQVAEVDRAHPAGGLRRLLGAAGLGQGRPDQD